jgi:hypothetical protein
MDVDPELLAEPGRVENPRTQRPAEGLALHCDRGAFAAGMQPRASARESCCGIHHDTSFTRYDPHE